MVIHFFEQLLKSLIILLFLDQLKLIVIGDNPNFSTDMNTNYEPPFVCYDFRVAAD